MAESNRNSKAGAIPDNDSSRASAPERRSPKADGADHRLRGTELESDFVDAEGDSCVVHKHRTDAESDS